MSLIEPLSQFLDNGGTFEWLRLRYLPPRIEAFYPAEFAPGTPGDISDFTDALLPLIVPGLQQDLDARLALLDELLVSGEACGTGAWAQRKAVKKLWDKAGPLLDKAGDEADLRARYLLLLDVDLPDLATIEDMAPPGHFRSESSIAAKIPGRRLGASTLNDDTDADQLEVIFAQGTLTLTAQFGEYDEGTSTFTLQLEVTGIDGKGRYPFKVAIFEENEAVNEEEVEVETTTYQLERGWFTVKEYCPERMVGKFKLRVRSSDDEDDVEDVLTIKKGEFTVQFGE